ncbi:MAG: RNA polymerase sigma factor [Myxococcaceae bacterium]
MSRTELDPPVVARAVDGDRLAQRQVVERYVKPLHRLVQTSLGALEADDVTQALLARVLEALPRFDPRGPATLTTWVFTVAHRFVLDHRKKAALRVVPLDEANAVPDAQPGADASARRAEWRTKLEAALGTLPDEQRRPLVLVHVFDHPLDEVAQVEGVPVGTIKSRLFRARVAMAQSLGPAFAEELNDG